MYTYINEWNNIHLYSLFTLLSFWSSDFIMLFAVCNTVSQLYLPLLTKCNGHLLLVGVFAEWWLTTNKGSDTDQGLYTGYHFIKKLCADLAPWLGWDLALHRARCRSKVKLQCHSEILIHRYTVSLFQLGSILPLSCVAKGYVSIDIVSVNVSLILSWSCWHLCWE